MKIKQFIIILWLLLPGIYSLTLSAGPYYAPTEYVSVCKKSTDRYVWRGEEYTATGEYTKTSPAGDTIYRLDLTISNTVKQIQKYDIPEGYSVYWRNKWYSKAGTYNDTIYGGSWECDTILQIIVNYTKNTVMREYKDLCSDSVLIWHGQTITQNGDYTYTLRNKAGTKDSIIYLLHVTYHTESLVDSSFVWCKDKLPFRWRDIELDQEGDYEFIYKNRAGCDSTVRVHLTLVDAPQRQTIKIAYCPHEGYTARGQHYYTDKTFTNSYPTTHGCDSIVDSMYIAESNTWIKEEFIRNEGEPYRWRGVDRTEDGVYIERAPNLTDPSLCDTVFQLDLKSKYNHKDIQTECKGQTISFTDPSGVKKDITENCDIREVYTSIQGTDSIVTHQFRFSDAQYYESAIALCENDSFFWYWKEGDPSKVDTIYGKNGSQTYSKKDKRDCYFNKLIVTVSPVFKKEETIFMSTDTFAIKGNFVWKDHFGGEHRIATPKDTNIIVFRGVTHNYELGKTQIEGGCDSTSILHFICHDYQRVNDPDYTLCEGGKITIYGKEYTEPGSYSTIVTSERGYKDKLIEFKVVTPTILVEDSILNGCAHDLPVVFTDNVSGRVYKYMNDTLDTITIKYRGKECDSLLIRLKVKINNRYQDTVRSTLCGNETYTLPNSGKVITKPTQGVYFDIWYDEDPCGCPKVQPHYLTVKKAYNDTSIIEKNMGDTWVWHTRKDNQSYDSTVVLTNETKNRTYSTTFQTLEGCDSIVSFILREGQAFEEDLPVVICSGDLPYTWRGKKYWESGNYYDSLKTLCCQKDSIYHLQLTVNNDTVVTRDLPLYNKQEYIFAGHVLTTANLYKTYSDSLKRKGSGCDSIDQVYVIPAQPYTHIDTICDNQQAGWKDTTWTDTLKSSDGWKVTIYSRIYPKPVRVYTSAMINQGDSLPWTKGGQTVYLKEQGTYYDSCYSSYGCDSVNILTLTIKRDYFFSETDSICESNLPYKWHRRDLKDSGIYYDSLKTKLGRDSVYKLDLTVLRPIIVYKDTDIYATGSITIGGVVYTQAGTVKEYIRTKELACDSLITIWRITKCNGTIHQNITIKECANHPVKINDTTFTQVGHYIYQEELKSINGCDSIIRYSIDIYPTYSFEETAHLCNSDNPYNWHGKQLNQPGVYYDSCLTVHSCDSIYRLTLTYTNPRTTDTTIYVCEKSFKYKGITYFQDTTFIEKTLDSFGCDSIVHSVRYSLCDTCSLIQRLPLCPGATLVEDGLTITQSGLYRVHHTTATGKDSLHRFEVYDARSYFDTITITQACDSFEYEGTWYYQPFTKENPLVKYHTSVDGCDSTTYLVLNLNKSTSQTYYHSIADFDSLKWNNKYYKTEGIYPITFQTARGCDSIEILNLKVYKTLYDTVEKGYCIGDPRGVEFYGKIYYPTKDTLLADTTGRGGEVPYVRRMRVYTSKSFSVTGFDSVYDQIVCASPQTDFVVRYTVADPTATPDLYRVRFIENGIEQLPKDSTYTITNRKDFTLPIAMQLRSNTCIYPGYYRYEITFLSSICECTSTVQGAVLVRYPESILTANWDNVVTILNEEYNIGHWKFLDNYQWTIYGQGGDKTRLIAPTDPTQPYIYSNLLQTGDRISVTTTRESYTIPVPSCEYIFTPVPTSAANKKPIIVYPTAVDEATTVHIDAPARGEYRLYNPTGHTYLQGTVLEGDNTLQMPGATGCYLLQVTLQDGNTQLQRLIVY